jgi:hypothetical protein
VDIAEPSSTRHTSGAIEAVKPGRDQLAEMLYRMAHTGIRLDAAGALQPRAATGSSHAAIGQVDFPRFRRHFLA